jgi:hypothetical protein
MYARARTSVKMRRKDRPVRADTASMQAGTQLAERPPDPPAEGETRDGGRPASAGYLAAVAGFAGGWVAGYALARVIAHQLTSGSELQGFSGLALALSIAGFLRIGIVAVALLTCFVVLRVRRMPGAGTTVILALAAWWLVTALMGLMITSSFRIWWAGVVVALVAAPLIGRAASRQLARRTSVWIAVALAVGGLVVSSFAAEAIGRVSSNRAVQEFREHVREQNQIDFTPYLPTEIPEESEGERVVFGPITPPPSITVGYGDATSTQDPHRFILTEFRATGGCDAEAPLGDRLSCEQVGELADGSAVRRFIRGDEATSIWIMKGTTVIAVQCLLEADQGCVRDDGSLNPQTLLVLDSLAEAVYTAAEPLSGDDPVIELANP